MVSLMNPIFSFAELAASHSVKLNLNNFKTIGEMTRM